MRPIILAGSAHPALAAAVARELEQPVGECRTTRFPDGEMHVEVGDVEGADVFMVEPTSSPVNEHLVELLLIADACRRAGASSVSAVIPYFGYARQDRRKAPGEALAVRVAADILGAAQLKHVVAIDLHSAAVEVALGVPLTHLDATPLLAAELRRAGVRDPVVVAPDLGAARRAREVASLVDAPFAIVHKVRRSGTEVSVDRVAGDVRGRTPILVDDMISTGATIAASARALRSEGSKPELVVAATHAVLAPGALERLEQAGMRHLIVTDTIAQSLAEDFATVVSVAPLLASGIRRLARASMLKGALA
jgi:ribose-phosphate pyrophosphokinase